MFNLLLLTKLTELHGSMHDAGLGWNYSSCTYGATISIISFNLSSGMLNCLIQRVRVFVFHSEACTNVSHGTKFGKYFSKPNSLTNVDISLSKSNMVMEKKPKQSYQDKSSHVLFLRDKDGSTLGQFSSCIRKSEWEQNPFIF